MSGDLTLDAAETALRQGSKSFAGASRLFDARVRRSATLLYAWCRHCDDLIDGQSLGRDSPSSGSATGSLDEIQRETRAALAGRPRPGTPYEGLAEVVQRHRIPVRYPLDLVEGFAMDVGGRRYDTIEDTVTYCYHVAGAVGVMMALIMGTRDEETLDRACDLGIAFQLTNIARDVADDAAAGRVYLPRRWLAEDGVAPEALARAGEAVRAGRTIGRVLDEAERYYASASAGIGRLPLRSALAIAAAREIYRAIGVKARTAQPAATGTRVSTTRGEKLALGAMGCVKGLALFAVPAAAPRPDGLWTRSDALPAPTVLIRGRRAAPASQHPGSASGRSLARQ
jgi:phytoene synthase